MRALFALMSILFFVTACAGPTGPAGKDGVFGTSGASGAPGGTGATGANGTTGANGANGASGASGPSDATGPAGASGATGPSGVGSSLSESTITSATTTQPNHGYFINGSSSVAINIPQTGFPVGDEVELSSLSASGFSIALSGTTLHGADGDFSTWLDASEGTGAARMNWYAVALDASGNNLLAGANVNRTQTGAAAGNSWRSLASDSTGTNLVAVAVDFWTSSDSGATWVNRTAGKAGAGL